LSKEAYYFSHDANARHDPKILAMRGEYGMFGYGVYWLIIEMMREQDEYKLPLKKYIYNAIAMQVQCTDFAKDNAKQFVLECINEFDLFQSDDDFFWSNSLVKRMEKKNDLSKKRSEAAKKRWDKSHDGGDQEENEKQSNANAEQNNANAMQNDARKGNEKKGNKNNIPYADIVNYLNEKTGKNYKPSSNKTKELIRARFNEGHTFEDFIKVIDFCSNEWSGKKFSNGQNGDHYLKPTTLFNGKFDERVNWTSKKEQNNNAPADYVDEEHKAVLRQMGWE